MLVENVLPDAPLITSDDYLFQQNDVSMYGYIVHAFRRLWKHGLNNILSPGDKLQGFEKL